MTLPSLPNALTWAEDAACRGYDLDLFFSKAVAAMEQAKQICARCPVRTQCLTETLRAEDANRYGVSGGMTSDERAELVRAQPADAEVPVPERPRTGRKIAPCGTRSAYQRHVRNGEPIDAACRQANSDADARLRRTGSTKAAR